MDVRFVTQNRESFTIEIGYFDTVLEIKEKIQKYKKIPVSQQTLVFNGVVLEDSGNVESCVILHNSCIYLHVSSQHKSPEKPRLKTDDYHSFSPITASKKTHLVLNLPAPKAHLHTKLSIDVDLSDSVEQLKKKIYRIEGFPATSVTLHINRNIELQDQRKLREYDLKDGSEIDVVIRPPSVPTPRKLKVTVVTKSGTKIPMEVNPMDKVQVIRNKLEKLQQTVKFDLPQEGYFFIYNQSVMEENQTFKCYEVRQDDTIDIFNGSVTGGP